METTLLYVELLIIGIETIGWITLFSLSFLNAEELASIASAFVRMPDSAGTAVVILLLGILYIFGMLIDRIADKLYFSVEEKCRKNANIKSKSTVLLWEEAESYFRFVRSKIRILRASCVNIPLLTTSILVFGYRHGGFSCGLCLFCGVLGIAFFSGGSHGNAPEYRKALPNHGLSGKEVE